MDNENKSCENCAHYFQHYGWIGNHFVKICCGHCKISNLTKKEKKNYLFANDCKEWQPKEKEITRQTESLKKILSDMEKRITEIKEWLENNKLDL